MSDSEYFATFALDLQPIYLPSWPKDSQKYFDQTTNPGSSGLAEDEMAVSVAEAWPSAALLATLLEASLVTAADTQDRTVVPHCLCNPSWSTGYVALPYRSWQMVPDT